ncbi:colicin immunity protein [Burkholderia anthinoferrum]|uniref:Colicin immunity protein n=2 Tax=Burkholderiaceae TaxID=119060 RepID=A0ABU5WI75_9BURK|nr:colicin immunity protein [Burkholderia anthinoferrum]MEB2502301.1 colicin immunity protein [Burkholderia anthinoferrum]MEB2578112.1 colicin immunity protein [Burkholderia anthinoferrum]
MDSRWSDQMEMNTMNIDHHRVYDSSNDFFSLAGSIVMKLTAEAAIAVCEQAAKHGVVVARIEGGIWRNPGFEARVDCIWDGADPPIDLDTAQRNNKRAAEFIRSESPPHDVFLVTAPPMTGWKPRRHADP